MASDDYVKQPPNLGKPFRFRFPPAPRMGASEELVSAAGVSHGYNGRNLFEKVNLVVDKGERIAFLGPNGAGKSTLLRLVVGQEEPLHGTCTLGSGVVKQYFEQNQADVLDLSKTVIDTLMGASTTEKYEDLRKLLGQFLFKGDAVEKLVAQLSGGEKARVALCKMMLTPANLLVLDEPTNHLDIPAKEMLEEALQHYEGSVLVVSHDRYFVSQVSRKPRPYRGRAKSTQPRKVYTSKNSWITHLTRGIAEGTTCCSNTPFCADACVATTLFCALDTTLGGHDNLQLRGQRAGSV